MIRSCNTPRSETRIREAHPTDAVPFRELRLGALLDSPIAFGADYQKNLHQPIKHWEDLLTMHTEEATIFLVACENNLIGMTGITRGGSPKTKHSAWIWGVYVKPEWRGNHVAEDLLQSCFTWGIERKVAPVKLGVIITNTAAIRCDERCGFQVYGTEPKAIYYDHKYYDEYMMYRSLDHSEQIEETNDHRS